MNVGRERRRERSVTSTISANAGTLRQPEPKINAGRPVKIVCSALGEVSETVAETHWDFLARLRKWGFPVNPQSRLCANLEEALAFHHEIGETRARLDYDIDGVVYKINRFDWQARPRVVRPPPPRG